MSQVINAVFGNGKTAPKIAVARVMHRFGEGVSDITALDMIFMCECTLNKRLVQQARRKAKEVGSFILDLSPSPAQLVQSPLVSEGFKLLPLQAACTYLLNSHEKDWEKHPGYYAHLIVEFLHREKVAREELAKRAAY